MDTPLNNCAGTHNCRAVLEMFVVGSFQCFSWAIGQVASDCAVRIHHARLPPRRCRGLRRSAVPLEKRGILKMVDPVRWFCARGSSTAVLAGPGAASPVATMIPVVAKQ